MNNPKMNIIIEGLSEAKEPFVLDYNLKDMYIVGIYPLSSKSKPKSFKSLEDAENYAIKFLKSLKSKKQIVPNNQRRAEIEHGGKVVKVIKFEDVL